MKIVPINASVSAKKSSGFSRPSFWSWLPKYWRDTYYKDAKSQQEMQTAFADINGKSVDLIKEETAFKTSLHRSNVYFYLPPENNHIAKEVYDLFINEMRSDRPNIVYDRNKKAYKLRIHGDQRFYVHETSTDQGVPLYIFSQYVAKHSSQVKPSKVALSM